MGNCKSHDILHGTGIMAEQDFTNSFPKGKMRYLLRWVLGKDEHISCSNRIQDTVFLERLIAGNMKYVCYEQSHFTELYT